MKGFVVWTRQVDFTEQDHQRLVNYVTKEISFDGCSKKNEYYKLAEATTPYYSKHFGKFHSKSETDFDEEKIKLLKLAKAQADLADYIDEVI